MSTGAGSRPGWVSLLEGDVQTVWTRSKSSIVALLALFASVACSGSSGPGGSGSDDPRWRRAFSTEDFGWVLSAAGRSSDAIYAVGGTEERGAMRRYDGESWTPVELPEDTPLLTWVHCFEDGTPVVAGFRGRVLRRTEGGWRLRELPTDQNLWGIWGASPRDLWAVGGNTGADGRPTILRRSREGWREMELPPLRHDDVHALFKVWGTGPDDVVFVGQNGTILHWDGSEITDVSPETDKDFVSIWGSGPRNVAAVGGRGNGILALREQGGWRVHSMAPLFGLSGIWVPGPKRAWIAGANGTIASVDLTSDDLERKVYEVDSRLGFHAIYGLRGAGLFAVGGNLTTPRGSYRGIAYHRPSID